MLGVCLDAARTDSEIDPSIPIVVSVSQPAAKRGQTGHHPAVASVLAVGGQWPALHQFVPPPKSGRERPQNGVSSASGCPYFALESEESNVDDMVSVVHRQCCDHRPQQI
ncbi:hypothetical protein FA13DRAFT_288474 [Coprinellus micaceus]|uniref:Uncharacterized protein n=1 Tax=Coprinellus micaceus TaxID=71717 RepID=A0A4Y7TDZ6_COPMI|nr:hypothetical protein FA13DRAFT_288474 [Coprinellus micaceus]